MWNRIQILAFTLLLQFMAPKEVSHFWSNGSYSCHSKPRPFLQQPHTQKKINVFQESKKMRSPFQNETAFINKFRQIHMLWISCSSYQERSPKLACLGISPEWKVFCFCSWWNQFCHPQHQHRARALFPWAAALSSLLPVTASGFPLQSHQCSHWSSKWTENGTPGALCIPSTMLPLTCNSATESVRPSPPTRARSYSYSSKKTSCAWFPLQKYCFDLGK